MFDIYVLGDVSSFVAALNSVVMVFGKSSFLASAALLGAMMGLLGFLIYLANKEAGGQMLMGGQPIVGLIAFVVFFSSLGIKTNVRLNDTFTGNTNIVSNVPAIIGMPASVITTAAYRVFDYSNVAFQSASGSYMSTGQFGFVMPLQILQSMRNGVEATNPAIVASLRQFIIDCAPGSAVNVNQLGQANDTLENLLTYTRDNGLTTWYDAGPGASPDGAALSCFEAKQKIRTQVDGYINGAFLNASLADMVNTTVRQKNPRTKVSLQDIEDTVDNVVIKGMGSTTQTSQQFMKNALLYNTISNTFSCLKRASDNAAFSECDIMMTQANEQWKTDAAAAGSLFAKTMLPAMVFLQVLFFSLAPIVIIYGLIRGPAGIGMYVKYLGFGVWTASWLPVSSAIQMYIQNNVAEKLVQMPANMITLRAVQPYYDIISTNLGLASDMLAATPLVTATILGVSSMAMTQLANNMGGKDRVNEKVASPDLMTPAAVGAGTSSVKLDGATGLASATNVPMPQVSLKGSQSSAEASALRQELQDTAQAKIEVSNALTANQAHAESLIKKTGTSVALQKANGWRFENGMVVGTEGTAGTKLSSTDTSRAVAGAQAALDFSAQLKTQIASDLLKSPGVAAKLAEKGIGQEKLASVVGESIAANASKDAGFMKRLMAGDSDAIGTVVDGIGWTATGLGVLTGGPVGGAAGLAAKAATRPLLVGGAKAAISGAKGLIARGGAIAERLGAAGSVAAGLFVPQASITAGMKVSIATDHALSKATADEQALLMKVAQSTTKADTTSQTRTTTDSSGTERSTNDSTTTTWASQKTFGALATQAASRAESYERRASQDRSTSADLTMTPASLAAMLMKDKGALASIQQQIKNNQSLVDQNWQAAEMRVQAAVQNFPNEEIRKAVIGTFAMADKEGNVFGANLASGGPLTPASNQGVGGAISTLVADRTGGTPPVDAVNGLRPLDGTPGFPSAPAGAAPKPQPPGEGSSGVPAASPTATPAPRPAAQSPARRPPARVATPGAPRAVPQPGGVPGLDSPPPIDVGGTLASQGAGVGALLPGVVAAQRAASTGMDRNTELSPEQINSLSPVKQAQALLDNDSAKGLAAATAAGVGVSVVAGAVRGRNNANARKRLETPGPAGGNAGDLPAGGSGTGAAGTGGSPTKAERRQPALFRPKAKGR
ncbi:conjugal transfer protein TraG N-terminal domain-containing protein [Rubrivivax gelatinosus]|uniref:conjugal transfer protein TraG N-terminal domain-containing protein n=1 Tax=Rubrivivax gelatinosus TaxID=28068 RepID=UPI0002FC9E6D|nr:conjugal transfer protein TraG N-terminal domain-containing protein [Rubrivivax gelatinosus]MBG6082999.1 conjugal transfer mating pair stabilization protein TraG [Rubrivivax gelatinosus]